MPSLFCFTTVSLRASIFATSMLRPVDADAVVGEVLAGVLVVLGRLQQRLRRDAADVGAGAARAPGRPCSFFHSSMQAVLKPSCAARIAAM